jgi:arylsulfatase A-like enzyme
MRVPGIAWWPGTVPAGVTTQEMASTMDLYVTAIKLAGGDVPADRPIDGYDLAPVLTGKGKSPRDTMFFYRGTKLFAVRHGEWKAHFITQVAYGKDGPMEHDPPLLYNLGRDPGEKTDVAKDNGEVVKRLKAIAEKHRAAMKPGEPQLDKKLPAEKK